MKKVLLMVLVIGAIATSCNYSDYNIRNRNFRGVIIKKYQDASNRYMWAFDVDSNSKTFQVGAVHYPKCWNYAEIGDSIIKKKDSIYIKICKPNGESRIFTYKE